MGVNSVYSRDIKLAVSRLHRVPGLFLLFSSVFFFSGNLSYYLLEEPYKHQIWVSYHR